MASRDSSGQHIPQNSKVTRNSGHNVKIANVQTDATIYNRDTVSLPSIANLAIWLDAADYSSLTLSSTLVTSWADRDGLGTIASVEATGLQRPEYVTNAVNGRPSLLFNSTNFTGLEASTTLGNDAFTVFTVCKPTSTAFGGIVSFDSTTDLPSILLVALNSSPSSYLLAAQSSGAAYIYSSQLINLEEASLLTAVVAGDADRTFRANGEERTSTVSKSFTTLDGICIGKARQNLNVQHFNGYISEVIIYTRALTSIEIQQVETYLRHKWSLNEQL